MSTWLNGRLYMCESTFLNAPTILEGFLLTHVNDALVLSINSHSLGDSDEEIEASCEAITSVLVSQSERFPILFHSTDPSSPASFSAGLARYRSKVHSVNLPEEPDAFGSRWYLALKQSLRDDSPAWRD